MESYKRYVLLVVLAISCFVRNTMTTVAHYSIPEEMKEGSVVANLATDLGLDVKTLNQRKMRVDIIANKKYVDVNKETGELYVVEKIDREYLCPSKSSASCYVKLEVILENPVRIFNIEVEILDMNDNAPQFRRDIIHLDISEATPKGERFSLSNAVDPDVGSNSVKTYHLSDSEYFSIEVQTGRDGSKFAEFILQKTLDREEEAIHNLILSAVDGGTPARSGTASIIVRVLDTNDNAPVFKEAIINVKIMENSPIGSLVVDLNATDLDEGSNSDITYSYSLYTSEKTQQTFNLNPSTGEITVKGMLNYEDFRIYDMEVIATDHGDNRLSAQCTIKILVEDMNDNHPEISIKSFHSPVNENIELDTVIAVVSVSDKDSGDNGVVDVHIPDNMPFKLRESSDNYYELVVSEPLDREKVPEYDITFTVTDRGSPPLSDNETMTLELLDVNDNVPQFPLSFYTIRVMENNAPGALLSSVTAFDPDLHENQYLVYFILEKEIANTSMSMLFSINPENGNLYALKTFDYEIEKEFLFHIEARDSGSPPLSSNVTVHIIIVDQNDNAPVIVSPWRAHGSVVEEKIPRSTDKGSLVAKVIALDTDSVHNSRITYQFLQVTDATLFSLDQYNGEIRTMRMFSYKDPRHQRMVVVAKDNGEPALSATVTIKLSTMETAVKAYSDMTEVPLEYDIFSDLNLYLVIGLGSVSFLLLITILVTIVLKCQKPKSNKAAPPSRNSVISERNSTIADSTLVSNDAYWYSLFLAETRKGKMVIRQPVPKGSRYIVSSIPRGTGISDTSDSAASTLQTVNKPDSSVVLKSCSENTVFLFIAEISSTKLKTDTTMLLNITMESCKRYVLLVFLFFSFIRNGSTSVNHYSIPEEMKEGSVVANLATDLGLDVKTLNQRKMRVDIIANKKYLDVNKETGELYVVEKIDREYICTTKSSASCYLKLEVTLENPLRIFNIEVEILDMNDNAPQFRRDAIHLDISEATPKGERFSLSNAVDPDVGSNSVKTYHLSESEHFNIEVQTGRDGSKFAEFILKKTLDREQQAVHNLVLTAVDGGTPARSGTVSIVVHVLDTNDNSPVFEKLGLNVNILENSPIGSLVFHLNATDLDEGSNSDITYSFSLYTSEKTQQTFNLNPSTGEITVKGVLNYEDFRIYDMEVIATDHGDNRLSAQCTIKILVEDMNDNHPEISIKSFHSPVNENIELDTVIAVVSVSDKDSGDNGIVDVHIPDNMPFKLRESSDNYYELVVSEPLDREKVPEYDITFTVTDRGSPPLSDNETMTLELLDVNDNVPQFPLSFYTIRVMENNAPGALLSSLTAFDPDLHENQYLVYFILEKEISNTSMSMLFSINPENGNLYALKTFDYEIEKEFLFHIEARDSGSPPLSSNVTVHIIIVDQNDNAPIIVSPWRAHGSVVEEKIPRSTDKGSLVAKVIALDTDSVHNSRITYQFLQVTDATLFSLDQYNGEIRTMRMFSYKDPRHQRMVVVAKDNGEPALSATVTIKLSTMETAVKAYSDMTEVPLEYDIFSDLNLYLVIGLGSVSFLLLITILVTIVLKCQKPKNSKAAPPSRNSVISERNSTIADSTLVSNDAYWYSLFLAETRKGKMVIRQPVPKGSRYIVSSIPRGTGISDTSDSAASTLQVGINTHTLSDKIW
ncbi:protocadherin alpha-C2-like [Solea senegalensis]|uniref:Protocadherin alpha-C2-like n=2 Tax=Solea senegalensis TaxID=28829 RepID=A0AAV6SLS6_SOLSE|nr:protocadherin alpha-C2-like [Solea senegalensis]